MKKALSIALSLSLILTALTFPTSAVAADTTASASEKTETPAPAPTPAKTTTSTPAPAVKTANVPAGDVYTVVSGDVFWKIAKKFGLTVDALAKLNPQIKNINKIYVGDKIVVKASATTAPVAAASKLYHGIGNVANYRIRNGNNDNLNVTTASAIFDQNGKIVDLTWDVLELTPTLFPGWVDAAKTADEKKAFKATIDNKLHTKREEGYDYDMTHLKSKGAADNLSKKEWFVQLDYYESFFKGKTVAEVKAWFAKYCDPVTGRPYKAAYYSNEKVTAAEKAKIDTFTAEERAMLVDVTTSATMALEDDHSWFITALEEAFAAKEELK